MIIVILSQINISIILINKLRKLCAYNLWYTETEDAWRNVNWQKSAIVQCVYQYEAPNNGPVVLGNEETY